VPVMQLVYCRDHRRLCPPLRRRDRTERCFLCGKIIRWRSAGQRPDRRLSPGLLHRKAAGRKYFKGPHQPSAGGSDGYGNGACTGRSAPHSRHCEAKRSKSRLPSAGGTVWIAFVACAPRNDEGRGRKDYAAHSPGVREIPNRACAGPGVVEAARRKLAVVDPDHRAATLAKLPVEGKSPSGGFSKSS